MFLLVRSRQVEGTLQGEPHTFHLTYLYLFSHVIFCESFSLARGNLMSIFVSSRVLIQKFNKERSYRRLFGILLQTIETLMVKNP